MSSFFIVLRREGNDIRDTLSQTYNRPFRLNGEWEVALTHLRLQPKIIPLFVFCDLVEYTYVNNTPMRFLEFVGTLDVQSNAPQYVKVAKKRFSSINVNIRQHPDHDDFKSLTAITCVLHFRKV